jgi:hypothetical protein
MNAIEHPNIYMRSLATRDTGKRDQPPRCPTSSPRARAGFDLVIVETSGIGQGDAAIVPLRRRRAVRDDPRVRRREPAREDRHARLRRLRGDQQVRPQGRRSTRCATCASRYQRNRELFNPAPPKRCRCSARWPRASTTTASPRCTRRCPALVAKGLKLAKAGACRPASRRSRPRTRAIVPPNARYLAEIADGCAATTHAHAAGPRGPRAPAPGAPCDPPRGCSSEGCKDRRRLLRELIECRSDASSTGVFAGSCSTCGRRRRSLRRRRVRREDPRQGDPHGADHDLAVGQQDPQGRAAALRGRRRDPALAAEGERPRVLPLHRRRVRVQARERGPHPHVRRRGRPVPHQPPLQEARPKACRRKRLSTAFDSVTLYGNDPDRVRTSTARSATPACRSPRSTT